MFWVGIKFLLPGWSIWRIFCYFCANFPWNWVAYDQFHEFFRHFDEFFGVFTKILKFCEINYVFAIVCIWISFVSVLVLLLKFIRIGLLTNRLGRNKIPYHLGNYSFPCGFAARERIISLVVRNFIPTRAIGQESYIPKWKCFKLNNYVNTFQTIRNIYGVENFRVLTIWYMASTASSWGPYIRPPTCCVGGSYGDDISKHWLFRRKQNCVRKAFGLFLTNLRDE